MKWVAGAAVGKKQSVDGVKHTNADRDVSGVERADGAIGEKRDGGGV